MTESEYIKGLERTTLTEQEKRDAFFRSWTTRTIAKTFEFDAGHRLSKGYVGKCANLHGHRYKVVIEISMRELNQFDMVTDFNDLKPFKELLDATLDHKMLLWKEDPLLAWFPSSEFGQLQLMEKNPTAEHIAEVILSMVQNFDPSIHSWGRFVTAVTVWETPNSWARVEVK